MGVKITKGGKGPVGSAVKAPGGEYVHHRKAEPEKDASYITVKQGDKLIRIEKKGGESKVQSVLTPSKNKSHDSK